MDTSAPNNLYSLSYFYFLNIIFLAQESPIFPPIFNRESIKEKVTQNRILKIILSFLSLHAYIILYK